MKGTEQFKQTIKAYLDERAKTDELFAVSYAKENKNWTIASHLYSTKQWLYAKRAVVE